MSLVMTRAAIFASSALLVAVALVCFFGGPGVGSAYLGFTQTAGMEFPLLTKYVSLPMLRIDAASAHDRPVDKPWGTLVWALLGLTPVALAGWAVRSSSTETVVIRWVVGLSLYLPFVFLVVAIVVVGLAIPIACL